MHNYQYSFLLVILIALPDFIRPSYSARIICHIRKNPADSSVFVNHLDVTIKRRGYTIWTGRSDDIGDFSCDKIESNKDPFDIFCTAVGVGTLLIGSLQVTDSSCLDTVLLIPAEKRCDHAGRILCPKCHKGDKVYPIEYGMLSSTEVEDSRRAGGSGIVNGKFMPGTCEPMAAKYYCDRDKVQF